MKNKLKIKAPVNSLQSGILQIESGANEIYCAYESNFSNVWTLSGRYKKSVYIDQHTEMSFADYSELVKYAHANNVKVELVANIPWLPDMESDVPYKNMFVDYVKRGESIGVDRVIIADIGNVIAVKEAGVKTPITASTFLAAINSSSIDFLESLGVSKVVLPHQLTINEIRSICQNTDLDIEVFAHFGCAFLEAACGMLHKYDCESNLGLPCRGLYDTGQGCSTILDVAKDCSLCCLSDLIEAGVKSIKIVGRDIDANYISTITYVYHLAIEMLDRGVEQKALLSKIKEEVDFNYWEASFCQKNRCKYLDEKVIV